MIGVNMFGQLSKNHASCMSLVPGQLLLVPGFLNVDKADVLLHQLYKEIDWQSEKIRIFGKEQLVPRQMAWHGDAGASYRYSGVDHEPLPWTNSLLEIRQFLESELSMAFNAVLLNMYRNGDDSMGWHSDDEPELGNEPVIASISLGQERKIRFRKKEVHKETMDVWLPHGSLLLMYGQSQQQWHHQLPKTRKKIGQRINLTFRRIYSEP